MVDDLTARWGLQVGAAYGGGTAGYVAAAVDAAGQPCVLKVAMPLHIDEAETFDRSVLVHTLDGGRACARLLAFDPDVPAMLLERLGPNLHELGLPVADVLATVARTLPRLWRPVGEDVALPTGADKAAWLAGFIVTTWEELDRPCDRAVIDRAVACCDARAAAFDPANAVLVHGDAHGWNTLRAGDDAFRFVDPEGLRSEPANDLAVPMREYNEPLLAGDTPRLVRERAELLAGWCGVDPEPVWQWGLIERVSTGLANLHDFADRVGAMAFLEVARRSR